MSDIKEATDTALFKLAAEITRTHAEQLASDPNLAARLDKRLELLPILVPLHISLVTLAKALESYGLEMHATERGEIEVRHLPLSREQALKMNRRNAGDYIFMAPDGHCSCGADLVAQYGIHAIAAGYSVTGCRKCHMSFVE